MREPLPHKTRINGRKTAYIPARFGRLTNDTNDVVPPRGRGRAGERAARKPGVPLGEIGKPIVEAPLLQSAISCIRNDPAVFNHGEWFKLCTAFAVLSGGHAEIEKAIAAWSRPARNGEPAAVRVRKIFNEYRRKGFDKSPGGACGDIGRWLRQHPVVGRGDEAHEVACAISEKVEPREPPKKEFDDGEDFSTAPDGAESAGDAKADTKAAAPEQRTSRASTLEDDPDVPNWVVPMNKEFAVFDGLGIARINPPGTSSLEKRLSWYRSTEAFTLARKNQKVTVGTHANGTEIVRDIGTAWIEHTKRRTYTALGLWPVGEEPRGRFNLWTGLGVTPAAGSWGMIKTFLAEVICAGDAAKLEWLLDWIACGLQRPLEKGFVNPVLIGEQGTGKTFFGKLLLRLFGAALAVHLSKQSDLTGDFNAMLEDKVFAFADEALFARDPQTAGPYKTLTTEETISINEKFEPKRMVRNRLKLVFASNSAAAVPVEIGDRRSVWFEVSNCRRLANGYFGDLQRASDAGELAAFARAMLDRDISTFDPRMPLRTEEKLEATKDQMSAVEKVIAGWIESGDLPGLEGTLRRMGKEEENPETRMADDWEDHSFAS
jgi:hypothetical protein